MKYFFVFIVPICLCACGSQTHTDCLVLEEKVAILEARIDSLVSVLDTKKIPTQKKKNGTGKNSGENIFVESGSGEKSYRENNYGASYSNPQQSIKKAQYSRRCQALTKKGYQCSRNARSGGYCWQHGG